MPPAALYTERPYRHGLIAAGLFSNRGTKVVASERSYLVGVLVPDMTALRKVVLPGMIGQSRWSHARRNSTNIGGLLYASNCIEWSFEELEEPSLQQGRPQSM